MSQQDDNSMGHSMELNPASLQPVPSGNAYNFNFNQPSLGNQLAQGPNILFSQDLAESQVIPDENSVQSWSMPAETSSVASGGSAPNTETAQSRNVRPSVLPSPWNFSNAG